MFKRSVVSGVKGLLRAGVLAASWGAVAAPSIDALPASVAGTFVQRKTLADVEVTITSSGTFRFEKDRFFEFKTLKPVPSTFYATPTNYTTTVRGKSTTRALDMDVSSFEKIFEIREVRAFVKDVKVEPDDAFPTHVRVSFKNGDVLDVRLTPANGCVE